MIDTIKKIFKIIGKRKKRIYSAIVFNLFHSIFSAFDLFAILYVMSHIDNLTGDIIWKVAGILAVGLIGKFICKWQTSNKVSMTAYDVFRDKRLEIGEKLKQAPMGYFNSQNLGSIQTAVTTGMNELESNAVAVVENMIGNIIYCIVCTVVLCIFNIYIGLISLAAIVINMGVLAIIQKFSDRFASKQVDSKEKMTSRVMEFVQGIMVMRLFTHKGQERERVDEAFRYKKEADLLVENSVAWPVNLYSFIFKLSGCGIIAASAILCFNGKMEFAYCMMFLLSAYLINAQTSTMGANIALLKVVRVALAHFDNVLNMPKMEGEKELKDEDHFDIKLENVNFGYTDHEIIHDVSMDIPYGSSIAIVGPSGSGKTTLCNLIARFFDVNSGKITIGGMNIKDLNPDSILSKISFVFQDVYLFEDTIENNIKFGRNDASHEDVVKVCKRARCQDFIMSLPDGYDTKIGEGGETLSGGEKQRISIARAMMKDAKIIILDEATSSVDPENEHLLVEALEELSKGKTLISIAHRLSTVSKADCIYVLEDGKVVQSGKHSQLIKEKGLYQRFIRIRQKAVSWELN